jgi:hypothetical protein
MKTKGSLSKKCPHCEKTLLLDYFYPIKASDESNPRWERICKECKKKRRNGGRNLFSPRKPPRKDHNYTEIEQSLMDKETIELRKNETNRIVNNIDFSELEECCGKILSDSEKYKAVERFNEFISILKEEYEKEVGYSVYVKD